jgi:hypothetical protein
MFSIMLKSLMLLAAIPAAKNLTDVGCALNIPTVVACALNVLTLVVLICQTRLTRKTLVSTFKPKLVLRRVSLCEGTSIPTQGVPDAKPWKVDYIIANTGGTKASITSRSFAVKMFNDKELPVLLPYAPQAAESKFSLQPGEEKEFSVGLESALVSLFRIGGVKGGYLKCQNTAYVYFLGYAHYEDELGVIRKMAILRHYDTETGRFRVVDDPDYEYAD